MNWSTRGIFIQWTNFIASTALISNIESFTKEIKKKIKMIQMQARSRRLPIRILAKLRKYQSFP